MSALAGVAPGPDTEPLAVEDSYPDGEAFIADYLATVVLADAGTRLGPEGVALDVPPGWEPEYSQVEFVQVVGQPGRGGFRQDGTKQTVVDLRITGPDRRRTKALAARVEAAMEGLDRGMVDHRGIGVDACDLVTGDAQERERDEHDQLRLQTWLIEWRQHFGATVWPTDFSILP